jgi:antitoxin ParD1/3/4
LTPAGEDQPKHLWKTDEELAADVAQAKALRAQARAGGLRFEAFLTSNAADWVLGKIEEGVFSDPGEALFVILQEAIELWGHPDLRRELLNRGIQAAIDDPSPRIPADEVFRRLEEKFSKPRPEPAVWRKQEKKP